jgi:hypothetical protein
MHRRPVVCSGSFGDSLFILSDEQRPSAGTSQTVEPVLGQLKSVMGGRSFLSSPLILTTGVVSVAWLPFFSGVAQATRRVLFFGHAKKRMESLQGFPTFTFEMHTLSPKLPCHRNSRTLATQSGMTNQWLKCQGLLSVKDLWATSIPRLPDYQLSSLTQ